jgi:hypothetical protein
MSGDVKHWIGTVEASSARGDEAEATATTGGLDRTSDIVRPEGAETEHYERNPVIFYGHAHTGADSVPIAMATALGRTGDGWRIRWRWNTDEKYDLAQRVRRAWDGGFLRTLSIGFKPLRWEPNAAGGTTFTAWEWLETSIVPIPANAEASRELKALGLWAEPLEFPTDMRPQDFVRMCRDAVQRGLKEYIDTVVRHRLAHRGGSDPDREVLTLDPPLQHIRRAHAGNLVGEKHIFFLDGERRR